MPNEHHTAHTYYDIHTFCHQAKKLKYSFLLTFSLLEIKKIYGYMVQISVFK